MVKAPYWILVVLFFALAPLKADSVKSAPVADETMPWQARVNEINEKIEVLKRWKEGYELTAERANFKADRLQFRNDDLIDSRRLWKTAQNAEQKAKELQILIDELTEERNQLLRTHGQPIPAN